MAQNPSGHQPDSSMSADVAKTFTSTEIGSVIDLRAQTGFPNHSPQLLYLCNTDPAAPASAVLKDRSGNAFTVPVPASSVVPVDCGVTTIEAATTDASTFNIVAFWWVDAGTVVN